MIFLFAEMIQHSHLLDTVGFIHIIVMYFFGISFKSKEITESYLFIHETICIKESFHTILISIDFALLNQHFQFDACMLQKFLLG